MTEQLVFHLSKINSVAFRAKYLFFMRREGERLFTHLHLVRARLWGASIYTKKQRRAFLLLLLLLPQHARRFLIS
jgi:formamidopyrimidine-DNA glycosylase